jgi:hypothetical protein
VVEELPLHLADLRVEAAHAPRAGGSRTANSTACSDPQLAGAGWRA